MGDTEITHHIASRDRCPSFYLNNNPNMKQTKLTSILLLLSALVVAQKRYPTTYQQLKEYEGNYDFVNHASLSIAASPKDTLLYAIINKSSYPLTPFAKDVFLNVSKNKITFFRNNTGSIAGYISDNDSFRLLDKHVYFPETMWYPRMNPFYTYQKPSDLKDDLKTGHIASSGLDTSLLNKMMHEIIAGVYPNVHSILIIKDGRLVFEEYFYEYNKDSLQELR